MKKPLYILLLLLATLLLLAYAFRETLMERVDSLRTASMFVPAERADFSPGPAVGSTFPGLQASFEGKRVTLLNDFAGPNGTLLVALRSVDWCPYCKRQLVQLQEHQPFFTASGIGLVAISYDSPEAQADFAQRFDISLPLLSDNNALSFRTLGILNESYQPGDSEYGVPHPGMIIVDDDNKVVGKLFLKDFGQRVDSAAALAYARRELGLTQPFGR
tara:strand:- start:6816 stop:7466 length:651 start_codon:yes stop_codon:yes gene_type:complete